MAFRQFGAKYAQGPSSYDFLSFFLFSWPPLGPRHFGGYPKLPGFPAIQLRQEDACERCTCVKSTYAAMSIGCLALRIRFTSNGMVVTAPIARSVQPVLFRRPSFNLSARISPIPAPSATRVPAMNPISGIFNETLLPSINPPVFSFPIYESFPFSLCKANTSLARTSCSVILKITTAAERALGSVT
jgi:hypothetical protein